MRTKSLFKRSFALGKPQHDFIEAEAVRLGVHAAEVVRRAVAEYQDRQERLIPRQRKPHDEVAMGQSQMPLDA